MSRCSFCNSQQIIPKLMDYRTSCFWWNWIWLQSICTLICSRAFGLSDRYFTAIIEVVDTVSYPEYMRVIRRSMIWSSLSFALVPSLPLNSTSSMSSLVQPEDLRSAIICRSMATSFFLAWKTTLLLLEGSVQVWLFFLMFSGMQVTNSTWSPLL